MHNIRMCHHVISSSALTQQQLREVEAVAKVGQSEYTHKLSVTGKQHSGWAQLSSSCAKVQARAKGRPLVVKETHNDGESTPACHRGRARDTSGS